MRQCASHHVCPPPPTSPSPPFRAGPPLSVKLVDFEKIWCLRLHILVGSQADSHQKPNCRIAESLDTSSYISSQPASTQGHSNAFLSAHSSGGVNRPNILSPWGTSCLVDSLSDINTASAASAFTVSSAVLGYLLPAVHISS